MRERYERLRADEAALEAILADGAARARAIAAETLADVRERMGVGPRGGVAVPRERVHRPSRGPGRPRPQDSPMSAGAGLAPSSGPIATVAA